MTTPAITYTGPAVESSVPFEIRRHLQLIYQKLGNHTQAFALQQAKINAIKSGTSTTIEEGGSGGGFVIPATSAILAVNNQSGVTSYATVSGDDGALITLSDASPIAVSLTPQQPPWGCFFVNLGAATATLTQAQCGSLVYVGTRYAIKERLNLESGIIIFFGLFVFCVLVTAQYKVR